MLHKILHTLGGKFAIGIGNLILLLITTRWLGPETKGEISLFVLDISFIAIVSGFISGPSLVYLGNRMDKGTILTFTYVWAAISTVLVGFVCYLLGTIPQGAFVLLLSAGFVEAVISGHFMMLLSTENITKHNLLQVFKLLLTIALLITFYKTGPFEGFTSFAYAFILSGIVSLVFVAKRPKLPNLHLGRNIVALKAMFKLGAYNQIGNLAQLVNYRLAFYIIEFFAINQAIANTKVGVYSTSLQVAEILWLVSRSISMVQYARISNLENKSEALQLTYGLIKLSFAITIVLSVALVAFPKEWYVMVLGQGFSEVRPLVLLFLPGIIIFTVSGGLSHLSSGLGLHRLNMTTSLLGAMVSIPGYILSYRFFGLEGLALCTSMIYIVQTFYQLLLVKQHTGFEIKGLVPSKRDLNKLYSMVK